MPKEASEGLRRFKETHPRPSQRPDYLESLWAALTEAERARAQRGAEGVRAYCAGTPKLIASVVAADKFLGQPVLWAEFERFAPPPIEKAAPAERHAFPADGPEFHAVALCRAIAGQPPPRAVDGAFTYLGPMPAGVAAMAELGAAVVQDYALIERGRFPDGWHVVRKSTPPFAAWRDRVAEYLGQPPTARRFWLDADDRVVETADQAKRLASGIANSCEGLLVPVTETGFPPAKGKQHDPPPQGDGTGETD